MSKSIKNTDREIFREYDDYYSSSLFVTENQGIGINVGGTVFVMKLKQWHKLAQQNIERKLLSKEDSDER